MKTTGRKIMQTLIERLIEIKDDHAALGRPKQAETIAEAITLLEAMPQWVKCSDERPNLGSRFLGWDGKTTCLFTVPHPSRDITTEDCIAHLKKMIEVYKLECWQYLPTP